MRWLLLLSAFLSSAALAQEQTPADPMAALVEVRERLRAYERDANNRQNLLGRKAQVLQLLTEGADSISAFGAGFAIDRARKKLEEARRLTSDATLGEPLPAVLGALDQLLSQPGHQTAAELRANAFLTISRFEEDLLQQTEALQREALELQQLATGITMTQNNLSATSANSVRTSIRARPTRREAVNRHAMKRRVGMIGLLSLLLLLQGAPAQTPSPAPSRAVTCSFSNPGYSGWCRVVEKVPPTRTPQAVCRDVLNCLNDVRCIKTYCNATEIRINWKLEKVKG